MNSELQNLLNDVNDPADNYVHMPNHNYFSTDSAKEFLLKKIWPTGRNKNLYSFFDSGKRTTDDIVESIVPLSATDADVLLGKPTVFDTFIQIDAARDKRGILDSYFLPQVQSHLEGWQIQQNNYLDNLNDRQKAAINAYTFNGDKFINGFLRGLLKEDLSVLVKACVQSKDIPFKYAIYDNYDVLKTTHRLFLPAKETLLKTGKIVDAVIISIVDHPQNREWFYQRKNISFLIVGLVADLTKVIYDAPRTRQPLVVYRGVISEHSDSLKVKTTDFWSTSLDPYAAIKFCDMGIGKRIQGVVYEIKISPKIPCLFLERFTHFKSSEQEVLLPPGITFTFDPTIHIKMRVEKNPYIHSSFNEYVERAMTTAVKYRILTINGVAKEFSTNVLTLRDIVREWQEEKERKQRREQRYLDKYAGPHLSRENERLPILKQVKSALPKLSSTRRSRSSRERNLSRRRRRLLKAGTLDSRNDVDFEEADE